MCCFDSEGSDDSECPFFSRTSGSAAAGVWAIAGVVRVELGGVDMASGPLAALRQSLWPGTVTEGGGRAKCWKGSNKAREERKGVVW